MKRLRGFMFLGAGLVLAVLAGVVGFVVLVNASSQGDGGEAAGPEAMVVIVTRGISARSVLGATDLEPKGVSEESIPQGAIMKVEDALGKVALSDLYAGEVVLTQRLVDPNVTARDGRTALVLAKDKVLMAFPAKDLMSRIDVLKPGDSVDLLFSFDFPKSTEFDDRPGTGVGGAFDQTELSTFGLLHNVTISAVIGGEPPDSGGSSGNNKKKAPDALLLTLSPQDALIVKYMRDAGGVADVVLRSPGDDRPSSTDPVDVDYIKNRYSILSDID